MQSINPATEVEIARYAPFTDKAVAEMIAAVNRSQKAWSTLSFDQRQPIFIRAAEILRKRSRQYAELMADEMGKPIREGEAEVKKCAAVCDYYAAHAAEFLADETVKTEAENSYISYRPLGVILAIMPWNFPFWQVFRCLAPNLMAGNAVLLKHAPNVTGSALAIESLMKAAGLPQNLFKTLIIEETQVEAVIQHKAVRGVALTGSTKAGQIVASQAGQALKRVVLELGGSDPFIVLEDADLDKAVQACVTSRLINSGQSCIAAKRIIVCEAVYDEFLARLKEQLKNKKMGDPKAEKTDIGPLARPDLRDQLHRQVQDSMDQGAKCVMGGKIPDRPGYYYPVTLLADIKSGMPAYDEELFGPVAVVIKAADEETAITIANDTDYGLGAALFTADRKKGERIAANALDAGCCFVNDYVRSDPRLPFGGIKKSGYGRELSRAGIREFVNHKTIYIA